jgi:hypothetical protein
MEVDVKESSEAWVFPGTEQEKSWVNGTEYFVEIWDFFC